MSLPRSPEITRGSHEITHDSHVLTVKVQRIQETIFVSACINDLIEQSTGVLINFRSQASVAVEDIQVSTSGRLSLTKSNGLFLDEYNYNNDENGVIGIHSLVLEGQIREIFQLIRDVLARGGERVALIPLQYGYIRFQFELSEGFHNFWFRLDTAADEIDIRDDTNGSGYIFGRLLDSRPPFKVASGFFQKEEVEVVRTFDILEVSFGTGEGRTTLQIVGNLEIEKFRDQLFPENE